MIFISTSCIKAETIRESIISIAEAGFKNIELSGGTKYYAGFESDLLLLKNKYNLNYISHNYFPPPKIPFVINLASSDENIRQKTISHFNRSIKLAKKLDISIIGMHAGFFIDPKPSELGKPISLTKISDRNISTNRFVEGFKELSSMSNGVKLYIENNVLSLVNYDTYKQNPLMLTSFNEYIELKKQMDFFFMLDVAHLKVSCNTLGLDFKKEFALFLNETDYLHLSDNNGLSDSNEYIKQDSSLLNLLKTSKDQICNKIITLEIYEDMTKIKKSYELIFDIIKD